MVVLGVLVCGVGVTPSTAAMQEVATASGNGYWLVAADGGVFSFGDAGFYGSLAGRPLDSPIVDIVPSSTGRGYRLVAEDGGVFAFGDATFEGSTAGRAIDQQVVAGASNRPAGVGGTPGDQGDAGPKGETGATGERGPRGLVGPAGDPGPVGLQGDQGDTGERGDIGPAGPTEAYWESFFEPSFVDNQITWIYSTSVPAGTYTVTAVVSLEMPFNGLGVVACTVGDSMRQRTWMISNGGMKSQLVVIGAVTVPIDATLDVVCLNEESTTNVYAHNAQIIATPVGTLHRTVGQDPNSES